MQHSTPNVSQSSPERGRLAPATAAGQCIHIRIHRDLVLPSPTAAKNPHPVLPVSTLTANPPTTSPQLPSHLYLIEGTFDDISRFAGTTVDWVIKIAHFICDPLGTGQLYTHTTGTSLDWYGVDRAASWRQVAPGDALLPGIYEFKPAVPISLSRVSSERKTHSVTSAASKSNASTFRRLIELRDAGCVVTRYGRSTIASHLIPKRLGSDGAKSIVTRFAGVQSALDIDKFDPRIGILLYSPLDNLADHFQLGFYHVTGNTYTLHNFDTVDPDLSVTGEPASGPFSNNTTPRLHNSSTTLSIHDGPASLPPKGVFDWHYTQCVINRFGTPAYKNFPDIRFFVHAFKSASDDNDSDGEYPDDDKTEPLYPSYRFDRFLAEQGEKLKAQEVREEVARWSSGVHPPS